MNIRKFLNYSDCLAYLEKNKATFDKLYLDKNLTARNVAENQNIHYDNNFQKALLRVCGKKGNGLGGVREGSGNKKGAIRFCGKCKKQTHPISKCACD